jgi:hypothetical protein
MPPKKADKDLNPGSVVSGSAYKSQNKRSAGGVLKGKDNSTSELLLPLIILDLKVLAYHEIRCLFV